MIVPIHFLNLIRKFCESHLILEIAEMIYMARASANNDARNALQCNVWHCNAMSSDAMNWTSCTSEIQCKKSIFLHCILTGFTFLRLWNDRAWSVMHVLYTVWVLYIVSPRGKWFLYVVFVQLLLGVNTFMIHTYMLPIIYTIRRCMEFLCHNAKNQQEQIREKVFFLLYTS